MRSEEWFIIGFGDGCSMVPDDGTQPPKPTGGQRKAKKTKPKPKRY